MPTVDWNKEQWGEKTDWSQAGGGWSDAWGGPEMQWYGSILPRIRRLVPCGTILEIAPGFGRWTHFLKDVCERLIIVDLVPKCIEACRARFADCDHIVYHVNDGRSLDMVPDDSVDFVFSFDSLVHVQPQVIESYVSQFPRLLKSSGHTFLHHSNLGNYAAYRQLSSIPLLRKFLQKVRILERNTHNRDPEVTSDMMQSIARKHGLSCLTQEVVNWHTRAALIDCLTVLHKGENSGTKVWKNNNFMKEAGLIKRMGEIYAF